jgi:hypothetical protein
MKKIYTNIAVALMAVLTMTGFTSCDSDVDLAYDLDGIWQGTIIGNYYYDRYGTNYTDYDTEIRFYQDGAFSRGGTGYEIDRDNTTGRYTRSNFDWTVRNGRIYLSYDDGYDVIIRDYETYTMGNAMRFRGYFEDYRTGEQLASFNLIKVSERYSYAKNMAVSDSITIEK